MTLDILEEDDEEVNNIFTGAKVNFLSLENACGNGTDDSGEKKFDFR